MIVTDVSLHLWAKLSPRDGEPLEWHPLHDHCCDVAACVEALLARPLVRSRLAALAGVSDLPELWIARLIVLAFLHDFGKANHAFRRRKGGHIAETGDLLAVDHFARKAGLTALDDWSDDHRSVLLALCLAHHGAAPEGKQGYVYAWEPRDGRDPLADVEGLVAAARTHWPEAFVSGGPVLPGASSPFWHAFLGLLQLADWVGSDSAADAFPFSKETDGPRVPFARRRATELLERIGFGVDALRAVLPKSTDFGLISDHRPTQIQLAAATAPGPVVVLESETGSGKTEAALWRFVRLFTEGKVDGLYFALPTRVAATQMHARLRDVAARMFGNAAPEVVRALPGDVLSDEAAPTALPGFDVQWSDDPDELLKRSRWAAERPKRFLASTIAVGTIDQALLGAVRLPHAQMRSFCLSKSLLVVDEVHSSDFYMEALLRRLLDQHRRAGGEAILLSATLGAPARTRLLTGRAAPRGLPNLKAAVDTPYPAISYLDGSKAVTILRKGRSREKAVRLRAEPLANDPTTIARRAAEAARMGARVLVIRNTVSAAVAAARALEADAPDLGFSLDGVNTLHHGRFAKSDRIRLDHEVERRLGKKSPDGPVVVIGTQTLEQSLDIDADFMITDLAPIDVLLQRIGRLHRHDRARPKGFDEPQCLVLTVPDLEAVLPAAHAPHGWGTVYEGRLGLAATRELIGDGVEWRIPEMNRDLVERATHPEALGALEGRLSAMDPRWANMRANEEGGALAKNGAADAAVITWNAPACEFRPERELRLGTRLGAGDRRVAFHPPLKSPFPGSARIDACAIPHHQLGGVFDDPDPPASDIAVSENGFSFSLGRNRFDYSRFGLQRIILTI